MVCGSPKGELIMKEVYNYTLDKLECFIEASDIYNEETKEEATIILDGDKIIVNKDYFDWLEKKIVQIKGI